jgi:hypothetical protein
VIPARDLTDTETALIEEHFAEPASPDLYAAALDAALAYNLATTAYAEAERARLRATIPDFAG